MSRCNVYPISCPSCGKQQDVYLYESINVEEDPELKVSLMENKLNRVECTDCDASFRVDMPLLYNDPKNKVLIHWMPEAAGTTREQILEDFDRMIEDMNGFLPDDISAPSVRLVTTRVELVELIFMIEAGFNQRVVEYIKYSIYTRNMEKLGPQKYRMLLNIQDSTDEELCFVMQDVDSLGLGNVLRYGRKAYQSMCDLFAESQDEFMDMFPGPCISARNLLLDDEEEI